jgi:hypothetical protein
MTTRSRDLSSNAELPGLTWRRSSHSTAANNCVETARLSGQLAVRDSKDPQGPALLFRSTAWTDFVQGLTGGGLGPV